MCLIGPLGMKRGRGMRQRVFHSLARKQEALRGKVCLLGVFFRARKSGEKISKTVNRPVCAETTQAVSSRLWSSAA